MNALVQFHALDIDRSRGFGVVTTRAPLGTRRHQPVPSDCTRTKYAPETETFVVSPANARTVLGTFQKRAKTQLLIYDPKISDKRMLGILRERARAGVEIRVIGSVAGRAQFDVQELAGTRLHTRTIVRDRRQAFIESQRLRIAELNARRELGLIMQDAKTVKSGIEIFESVSARPQTARSRSL